MYLRFSSDNIPMQIGLIKLPFRIEDTEKWSEICFLGVCQIFTSLIKNNNHGQTAVPNLLCYSVTLYT